MMAEAYKKATKKEKGRILDHVVEVAGYNRAYASCRQGRLQIETPLSSRFLREATLPFRIDFYVRQQGESKVPKKTNFWGVRKEGGSESTADPPSFLVYKTS
jgi:hypothetical protein